MYHSPLKLYEYGAMGVPALAVRHDETTRFVEVARHGYLFDDDDDLAAVIERAAGQLDHLRKSRRALREHVVRHHSWDHRVSDLLGELRRRGLLCV
jgi:glycosyltransferase involved in cell wall biosynthesis